MIPIRCLSCGKPVSAYFDEYNKRLAAGEKSKDIFGAYYNEKLFREQLCFFQDVDRSERVDFVVQAVSDEEIKQFLTDIATSPF